MSLFMEFSWQDPRLTLNQQFALEFRENAETQFADGGARTANVTISTQEWRRRGLWLPPYRVMSSVSGLEGELADIDDDVDESNVTVILSPYDGSAGYGERLWPQQRLAVRPITQNPFRSSSASPPRFYRSLRR